MDGVANTCIAGEPVSEACNDLDDDCDGAVDEGCDDDHDGYCDMAFTVVGRPKVCPLGGPYARDCDDTSAARNPGQVEICEDDIDNDCNGLVDYLDINRCVPVTASFQDADGLVSLLHGNTQVIRAILTPPSAELERRWAVTSALPDTSCAVSDVTIASPEEQPDATLRTIGIVDDPNKLDCRYELTLFIGEVPADRLTLSMRNPRPRVDQVVGATLDGDVLVLRVAAGTNPWITAVVPSDDDVPVVVEWVGQNASRLDCGSPCVGSQMRFKQPLPVGTYNLRLRARDGFDRRNRVRDLRIEAAACVWANALGSGNGTGPARTQAFGTLQAAMTAALSNSAADVCISGGGTFNLTSPLTIPGGLELNAAFDEMGMPSSTPTSLVFGPMANLAFAPGSAPALRMLTLQGGGAGPLVEVRDASPTFFGVEIVLSGARGARGIHFETTGVDPAQVRVVSSRLRAVDPLTDATGIEVEGGTGIAELIWNGASTVDVLNCAGTCRGVALHGRAKATLVGERIDVEAVGAGSLATAIEVIGNLRSARLR